MELTILMPCLNEEETLERCITKARMFLSENNIDGEILIADNGSSDKSVEIAEENGARVCHVPQKGYGSALIEGTNQALGQFIIMGDSDCSYDFLHLEGFVEELRKGNDLVMGNRFKGGIDEGAMPSLHKIGTPVLSWIGRVLYHNHIGDYNCGLRGYNKNSVLGLNLNCTGMDYASEMIIKASLAKLKIVEIPTTLSVDGRSREPYLNTWEDGFKHLGTLLKYKFKKN